MVGGKEGAKTAMPTMSASFMQARTQMTDDFSTTATTTCVRGDSAVSADGVRRQAQYIQHCASVTVVDRHKYTAAH